MHVSGIELSKFKLEYQLSNALEAEICKSSDAALCYSATYRVLVNGTPSQRIVRSHGWDQARQQMRQIRRFQSVQDMCHMRNLKRKKIFEFIDQ